MTDPVERAAALRAYADETAGCTRCALAAGRTQVVFGAGNPDADLLFVGEAPGRDEDEQGLAFVGRAGQLLTKIIEAIGMKREDVFICNVLRCRPPNNRNPEPDEVASCMPFLDETIRLVGPRAWGSTGGSGTRSRSSPSDCRSSSQAASCPSACSRAPRRRWPP